MQYEVELKLYLLEKDGECDTHDAISDTWRVRSLKRREPR